MHFKIVIRDVAKRTAAKQTKWFPVVGQAVSASISYYFMNKIGKDHIQNAKMLLKCHVGAIIVLQFANFTETGFKRIEFKAWFW